MDIKIDKSLKKPIYWQIADGIKELILTEQIGSGAILPTERKLAQLLGVHRNTIIKAYNKLKQMDFIRSVPREGYVVCGELGQDGDWAGDQAGDSQIRPDYSSVNWAHLIKDEYLDMEETFDDMFQRKGIKQAISMGTGLPRSSYSKKDLLSDMDEILAMGRKSSDYIPPYQGDLELRRNIAEMLRMKGINTTSKEIQILSETNQATDFIITSMLDPGDSVIIEEPVSPDVYRPIMLAKGNIITVPVDENGMIVDHIEGLIKRHKPKFIFVNSSFHDPTGAMLSLDRRKKLLDVAYRYGIPIVEEDAASELAFGRRSVPTLKSMDRYNNVIYIYSFALTFVPGLSMAFVVGHELLIHALSYLVSVRMMSLEWLTQKLIAKYLGDGRYAKKLPLIVKHNHTNMTKVVAGLKRMHKYGLDFTIPQGGVYLWCKLPSYMDARVFVNEAHKQGLSLIAGYIFFPFNNDGRNMVRINYSYETPGRIDQGMNIFNDVFRSMLRE